MTSTDSDNEAIVSMAEAQAICCEKLRMSEAQFRHELAEHVRGNGGIPWIASPTVVGMRRSVLEALIRDAGLPAARERPND